MPQNQKRDRIENHFAEGDLTCVMDLAGEIVGHHHGFFTLAEEEDIVAV